MRRRPQHRVVRRRGPTPPESERHREAEPTAPDAANDARRLAGALLCQQYAHLDRDEGSRGFHMGMAYRLATQPWEIVTEAYLDGLRQAIREEHGAEPVA